MVTKSTNQSQIFFIFYFLVVVVVVVEQGDDSMLNDDGIPKQSYPNHWKGKNGLYCVGLSRKGLYGAAADAQNIADHINSILRPS